MHRCAWLVAGMVMGVTAAATGQCVFSFESPGAPGAVRVSSPFGNQQPGVVACATRWDPDAGGPEPEWLVVGGSFTHIDGVPAVNVAAWDGQRWRALGSGLGMTNSSTECVYALTVHNGGLYGSGRFMRTGTNGPTLNGIARFDGSSWLPVGTGVPGNNSNTLVHAMASFNGDLYAGGGFGNVPPYNIAKWNGTQWTGVYGGLGVSSSTSGARAPVMALHVHQGSLYAAGAFQTSFSPPYGIVSIARLNPAGGWEAVGSGLGGSSAITVVQSLVSDGDDLLAVGRMRALSPNLEGQIARWDGATWTGMLTVNVPIPLNSVARVNGELMVGSDNMQVLRVSGQTLVPAGPLLMEPGSMINSDFRRTIVLGEYSGGALIGGNFLRSDTTDIDWRYLNSLSVWDGDGLSPISRAPDRSISAFVRYGGELYAVGTFLHANSQRCDRVARAVGDAWLPLGDGHGPNARVHCGVEWNGKLVVGGIFDHVAGLEANRVAAWNGTAWGPLGAGVPEAGVRRLFNYNGQLLAVCGDFTRITDFFTPTLRRWDGTAWVVFGNQDGSDANFGQVFVLNGELYGARQVAEGTVRWNGTAWVSAGQATRPVMAIGVWRGALLGIGGGTHRLGAGGWERLTTGQPSLSNPLEWTEYGDEFYLGGTDGLVPRLWRWNGGQWMSISQVGVSVSNLVNSHVSAFAEQNGHLLVGGSLNGVQQSSPQSAYVPAIAYLRYTPPASPVFVDRTPDVLIGPGQGTVLHVDVLNPTGVSFQWRREGVPLTEGLQSDGSSVTGVASDTLGIQNAANSESVFTVAVTRQGGCTAMSAPILVTVGCDTIDFNRDGLFPDIQDISDFLFVFAGGACPTTECGDIDFNNDTLFPSTEDVDVLLGVFSGAACS